MQHKGIAGPYDTRELLALMQADCQRDISLLHEELELQRTMPALPAANAVPSSLLLDLLNAAETANQPQDPIDSSSLHNAFSDPSSSIPQEGLNEDLSEHGSENAALPSTSGLQTEKVVFNSTATDNSSPGESDTLLPRAAVTARESADLSRSEDEEKVSQQAQMPRRSIAAENRDLSLLKALHAMEQNVASLQQHLARVQSEGKVGRLQLNRVARDVQRCLDTNARLAAQLTAQGSSRADMAIAKGVDMDSSKAKENHDTNLRKDLIKSASFKEAEHDSELLDLRRALESLTGVIAAMALKDHTGLKQQVSKHAVPPCQRAYIRMQSDFGINQAT